MISSFKSCCCCFSLTGVHEMEHGAKFGPGWRGGAFCLLFKEMKFEWKQGNYWNGGAWRCMCRAVLRCLREEWNVQTKLKHWIRWRENEKQNFVGVFYRENGELFCWCGILSAVAFCGNGLPCFLSFIRIRWHLTLIRFCFTSGLLSFDLI